MSADTATPLTIDRHRPLGQVTADALRQAIYAGRFRPGQKVGQVAVARELGVSQTTVREAFAALEREGLLERADRRGAAVVRLTHADIEEIIDLRNALEILAVRRLTRSTASEHFAELEDNIRSMQSCREPARLAELDLQFHETLIRFAGHKRLRACWRTLLTPLKLIMITHNLRNPRSPQGTVKHHRELLRHLRARDEAGAIAHLEQGHAVHRLQALAADDGPEEME
jgi:DNA-binding GntR family transcriptional regulator